MPASFFHDSDFQDKLIAHIVYDGLFLKQTVALLTPDDFKPLAKQTEGWLRWITANLAMAYWEKYRNPLARMLKVEMLDYIQKNHVGDYQAKQLLSYARWLRKQPLEAGPALLDKVMEFKRQRARMTAIDEILELQAVGDLTDAKMLDICRGVVDAFSPNHLQAVDFLSEKQFESRVFRRRLQERSSPVPFFLIDPLDVLINSVRRGQIALWYGPPGRGKSLALIWTALAYTIQGYNTLLIELEDSKEDTEDRIDAALTQIPVGRLGTMEKTFEERFRRMRRFIRRHLYVVDATDQECSLSWIENRLDEFRDRGILIDALITDYDDEITPPKKYKAESGSRRFEFADIYRGYRKLCAKRNLFGWLAAQTVRDSEKYRILTRKHLAEDISKIRKVRLAIGIGSGEEVADNAFYLWVEKNNNGVQQVGTYICHNASAGIFYHRERTRNLLVRLRKEREQEDADA